MTTASFAKHLSTWDATKQEAYRQKTPGAAVTFHFLLDASPSMRGRPAVNLRTAYNTYVQWLQHHADPMCLAEVRCFSTALAPRHLLPIGMLKPLTTQTYDPSEGDGTAHGRSLPLLPS